MKLRVLVLLSLSFITTLFAKPIKKEDIDKNLFSIKIGVFKQDSSIKKAQKEFYNFDTVYLSKRETKHFYIVNIKDIKNAKKILIEVAKPLYKDAYIVKHTQKKRYRPKNREIKKQPLQKIKLPNNKNTSKSNKDIVKKTKRVKLEKKRVIKKTGLNNNNQSVNSKETISLKNAILISLNRSHKILSLKEKVLQQKYKVDEKKGALLPNINLYSTTGYDYIHTRGDKELEDKYPKADAQLSITENIYAGGKHLAEIKREEAKLKSETAKFREKVEEETLKIIEAYINLYYQKLAIEVEKKNFSYLKKIENIVKIKEKNGAATKGDLNNIISKVENASTALVKANSLYQNSLAFYKYFLGQENSQKEPKDGEFNFPKYSKKELLSIFELQNAKLQTNRYKLEAQKYDYEAKKSPFKPTLDLIITGKEKFSKAEIDPFRDEKASAVLSLNYNLYKGGSDKAKLLNSKSKIAELQYKYRDILESTQYNLIQLFENISSLNSSLKHIENEVVANQKALDSYWEGFKYGNQDIQTLLLAQRALNRSQQDRLKEKRDHIITYFKLLSQTGELLKFLQIDSFMKLSD